MFNIINKPLGYVLRFLADIMGGDFAAAVAVFTLLINLILIPLSIKSQKSSVQQMRLKPKLDELKKKYGDDRQKMAQAQQELYQKEGVSMAGGCLPMLVRLILMMSIYSLIMQPLTYMEKVPAANVETVYSAFVTDTVKVYEEKDTAKRNEVLAQFGFAADDKLTNKDLTVIKLVRKDENAASLRAVLSESLTAEKYAEVEKSIDIIVANDNEYDINFNLFGVKRLDLTEKPNFSFNLQKAQLLWVIPFGAFLAQIITSLISMRINKKNNPDAPSMMGMMLLMPLMSLFIGFGLPSGVGFYWICSSLIGGLIQSGVQVWYGPQKMLARLRAKELGKQCDFETKQMNKFNNTDDDNTESLVDGDSESLIKD